MPDQIDLDDPRYAAAAAEILRRHDGYEAEANITSAIRDFLIVTGLANSDEINEEVAPASGSGKAVDLTALNAFIEVKRRVGSAGGLDPSLEYVDQLDGYLEQAETEGRMFRMGVLTDGRHWLLRWPGAGPRVRPASWLLCAKAAPRSPSPSPAASSANGCASRRRGGRSRRRWRSYCGKSFG